MDGVFQRRMPYDPFAPRQGRALPGVQPLAMEDWLIRDDAFAGQMAERDRILAERRDAVVALDERARPPALELLGLVRDIAYPGSGDVVRRPDGLDVPIDRDDPMGTLGRLTQEDFCILQKAGDEHVLTAAVLCFPASWMLAEKFLKPLVRIHLPVDDYDPDIAGRVQRLFDGVRPGRPLWRFNALWYGDPSLFQPRSEQDRRNDRGASTGDYFRSERQCILRLPESGAVVFSIHTYVVERDDIVKNSAT